MTDFLAARGTPERLERMKAITDRIPDGWGAYLPEVGWDDTLLQLDQGLSAIDPEYVVFQAKEKFGGLRFYAGHSDGFEGDDTYFRQLIAFFEAQSIFVCELCGLRGELRKRGWWKTLCDEHAKEEGKI